jgi:hypothetical protein
MKKRQWCYSQNPKVYCIKCDKCDGDNIQWSEFEGKIWCYDCEIDTKGTGGIFDGPISKGICEMMGIHFDKIDLREGGDVDQS